MADSIEDNIRTNATSPAEASVDGRTVKQHPLPDQIAADRYMASKRATTGTGLGIKLTKLSPPGTD